MRYRLRGADMMVMDFVKAFLVGGAVCMAGQALIMYTKLTTSRILVIFVISGIVLTALGLYKPLIEFAGAGASVPLTGFGYSLASGAEQGVEKYGLIGAFSGGIQNTAAGIAAAVFFSMLHAFIFKPKSK